MNSSTKINSSFTEEYVLDDIAKEAELRLQHEREQNREARQIRHKELEKSVQNDDDDDENSLTIPLSPLTTIESNKSYMMNMNGTVETNTNSLLFQKFLNGDIDLRSIEQRDLRRLLSEFESKY
ncbi:unnamed protein product, partial [Rotaria sp. Silwood1]